MVDTISYVLDKAKTEVGVELKSNKRNIISKIFDHLNYKVVRLDLVFFGGLTKKDIPRKKSRFLSDEEINYKFSHVFPYINKLKSLASEINLTTLSVSFISDEILLFIMCVNF